MQPWYLDIVCDDSWEVSIIEKNGKIEAALAYVLVKKRMLTYIMSPPFTPAIGLYMKINPKQKRINRTSHNRKTILNLFNSLPKYDSLKIKLSPDIIDWRSLFWNGYNQTTYYSSRIDFSKTMEEIFSECNNSIRALNKKAFDTLVISETSDSERLYRLISLTFKRKNKYFELRKGEFYSLIFELEARDKLLALVAKDKNDIDVGCIVCIEDGDTIYYIFGGFDSNYKTLGSQTALLIEAIEISRKKMKHFDFEGSMVKSIDKFFMAFDPDVLPYSVVFHTPSYLLKMKELISS